jgi:hypothetical protein
MTESFPNDVYRHRERRESCLQAASFANTLDLLSLIKWRCSYHSLLRPHTITLLQSILTFSHSLNKHILDTYSVLGLMPYLIPNLIHA